MPKALAWRFAREWPQQCDGTDMSIVQWSTARHACREPWPSWVIHLALCALILGVGTTFWRLGAPALLPLAGAKLLLLGAALWACSRHAADAKTMTLAEQQLQVHIRHGRPNLRLAPAREIRLLWRLDGAARADGELILGSQR
jgi:hypothetical protein